MMLDVVPDVLTTLNRLDRVKDGSIELDLSLNDLVVLVYIKLFLFERLDADKPAQSDDFIL